MKRLHLIIRQAAKDDLSNIWLYTFDKWSIKQADKYYNQLLDSIEFLCKNPQQSKSAEHLRKGYRYIKVNPHLIFYLFNEIELEVIRILQEQMDIPSRLDE